MLRHLLSIWDFQVADETAKSSSHFSEQPRRRGVQTYAGTVPSSLGRIEPSTFTPVYMFITLLILSLLGLIHKHVQELRDDWLQRVHDHSQKILYIHTVVAKSQSPMCTWAKPRDNPMFDGVS